ncbi:NAD-dependent epimerase/dehydratase family protein [Streptomyces scabiei]|uniref:NAD-dependent epimerase/dehydratase family protein n=1 Tax=Streptomyces scabiei TaxID=1930 RepID=UPI0036B7A6F4
MNGRRPLIAVLGASGFIGSAISAELAGRPVRLRTVARRPLPVPHGAVADVEPFQADLTRPGALADSVTGSDVVIYLVAHIAGPGGWRASEDDAHAAGVNLGLVRDLVAALRDGRRSGPPPTVLFAGTVMQVGVPPNGRIDGTEPDAPGTAYPRQKLAAERLLREATEEGVLRAVSLRLPTVYGHVRGAPEGGRDKGVVAMMIRRALRCEGLTMWGEGTVRRDLLHVDDVAAAFTAALDAVGRGDDLTGRHWVLGTGRGEPLRDLFGRIAVAVAERTGRPPAPVTRVVPPEYAEPIDFCDIEVDARAFRSATGWRPRVGLEDGLRRTAAALADGEATAPG